MAKKLVLTDWDPDEWRDQICTEAYELRKRHKLTTREYSMFVTMSAKLSPYWKKAINEDQAQLPRTPKERKKLENVLRKERQEYLIEYALRAIMPE